MKRYRVLAVDDEHLIRWSIEQSLNKLGYEVFTAASGEEALDMVREEHPDVVLLDINLPGISGVEVLARIKEFDEDIVVIMITAQAGLETAIKAMRLGAYDYIGKPFNLDEVAISIKKAMETSYLKFEVSRLRGEARRSVPNIVGCGNQMKNLMEMLEKIASSSASTVLVQGESGTGKELVARWIHYSSNRSDKPFVALNCAAVPATLLESELFGYEKGAFTDAKSAKKGLLEQADGGTIFLDEIGDMEIAMQAKMLRFLEDKSFRRIGGSRMINVDIRIISATNRDLEKAIQERSFRHDLYYRLQVIPILLPPLRDRREDILLIANCFIESFNREFNKKVRGISEEAKNLMMAYQWPGNVRELKNVIERAIILGNNDLLLPENLPAEMKGNEVEKSKSPATLFSLPPEGINIEELEKELIRQALDATGCNQSRAAKRLGLGLDAFRYRMKKFGLLN